MRAKYETWAQAVGDRSLAERLFQTALNLADAREGALFVVLRDPDRAVPELIAPGDRLQRAGPADGGGAPSRALATMDGATVVDRSGRLLAVGAILMHPSAPGVEPGSVVEGARTTAALGASRFGPALKVSEDGVISFFDGQLIWEI